IGHSGDRCWGKHNEGRSHFGAANFLEVLLNDEEATAIVEDLEVKCLTEDGSGIWEEEKSPKLGLFLNTLTSSEGPLSLRDDVFDIFDVGEELVACHMASEGNLDMSEDDRVVIRMMPEISTELAAMGVSSYSNNVVRGEHQADHGYLGLGSFGKTEVVQRPGESILHKQELDRDEPADEERNEGNAFNAGDDGTEKETGRNDLDSGEHTAEEDGGFQDEEEDQDAEVAEHKRKATNSDDRDLDQQQEDADLQQDDQAPSIDDEIDGLHEATDNQIAVEFVEAVQEPEKTATPVVEDSNIESKLDIKAEEPSTSVLPPSADEDDPMNQKMMMKCTEMEVVESAKEIENIPEPTKKGGAIQTDETSSAVMETNV
ncbi:unnamed protein product, partial [Sphagnum balticum]